VTGGSAEAASGKAMKSAAHGKVHDSMLRNRRKFIC
jgi:hypothetical protein